MLCQFPANSNKKTLCELKNFLAFTLQNHNLTFSLLLYMSEKSCNFLLSTNFYLLVFTVSFLFSKMCPWQPFVTIMHHVADQKERSVCKSHQLRRSLVRSRLRWFWMWRHLSSFLDSSNSVSSLLSSLE